MKNPPLKRLAKRVVRRLGLAAEAGPADELPYPLPAPVRSAVAVAREYSMSDPARLANLYGLVRSTAVRGVRGDIVECGVCRGGSAAVMAAAALAAAAERPRLWLYDTFEGIPAAGDLDGDHAQKFTGAFVGSTSAAREALGRVGYPPDLAVFRVGLFERTFQEPLPERVAVLHLDGDWYDSVLLSLRTFYPLVPPGGVIVLDDFGFWEGARRAFYAFCRDEKVEPLLERVGHTQAFWRKGAEHTRDEARGYLRGPYNPFGGR